MGTTAQGNLRQIHALLYQIIASNEGLWLEIGRLANDEEYLAIQDPMGRVEARLGLIEQKIGRTDDTRRLIEMIARTK